MWRFIVLVVFLVDLDRKNKRISEALIESLEETRIQGRMKLRLLLGCRAETLRHLYFGFNWRLVHRFVTDVTWGLYLSLQ